MKCTKCGNELSPKMKFCAKCGTAVPQVQSTAPKEMPMPNDHVVSTRPAPDKKGKPKKKNLALKIVAIVLAVAVLLTGGIFIFDSVSYKNSLKGVEYIEDFPVLKLKTEFTVYAAEKFPYEEYNIKVERLKSRVLKSGKVLKNETILDKTATAPTFDIDFGQNGEYQITLTGIVAGRTQTTTATTALSTAPSAPTETTAVTSASNESAKDEEPIVIIIIVKVEDDNPEAKDKVNLDSDVGYIEKTTVPSETPTQSAEPEENVGIGTDVKAGNYIKFGKYEQDGNTSNGKEDIEWLVLDVEDGKAFIVSKYALDAKSYNDEHINVTWEICTLRKWLNNDFYNNAFSANEQGLIATTNIIAEDNDYYGTEAGNDTQDKVFLLSINEANKYFSSDDERVCEPTQYAINQEPSLTGAYGENFDSCWWWLRSAGGDTVDAANVSQGGFVSDFGFYIDTDYGVRPAMWVKLG